MQLNPTAGTARLHRVGQVSIARTATAVGVLLFLGLMAAAGLQMHRSHDLEIGSSRYNRIIDGKDLVADLMPPPLFLVEAYLEARLIADKATDVGEGRRRLARMKEEYEAQWKKWSRSALPVELKAELIERSTIDTHRFWQQLDTVLLPSVERGDQESVGNAMVAITEIYNSHRASVVKIVDQANDLLMSAEADAHKQGSWLKLLASIVTVSVFTLAVLFNVVITWFIIRPLRQIAARTREISQGQLAAPIPFENSSNEIGEIATSLATLRDAAIQKQKLEVAVQTGMDEIKSRTSELAQASRELAHRTESQAASLEETATTIVQITETVNKTAQCASRAHEQVSQANLEAKNSGEVVGKAVEAMNDIERSSKQINQIISVIDEIAFQTNLLALNAGVEAARAGDAGRGFAVVATEVRALARRSADAARQIKELIVTSEAQVDLGVELVGEAGKALERIMNGVRVVNSAVAEIATGATEQATGLKQVSLAVSQMDQVTQQNAAMVEEATAATGELAQHSDQLARLVRQFQNSGNVETDLLRAELQRVVPHAFATHGPSQQRAAMGIVGAVPGSDATTATRTSGTPAKPAGRIRRAAAGGASQQEDWQEF